MNSTRAFSGEVDPVHRGKRVTGEEESRFHVNGYGSGREQEGPSAWDLWRRNGIIWLALLGLLTLTWGLAYVPLGPFNLPISLIIAFIKAALVAILFMELKDSSALNRLVVTIGLLMIVTLFTLTSTDVVTRVLNGWRE